MELNNDLKKLLDLSISLTGEKDYNRLLEQIIQDAMEISGADGGTLYLSVPEGLKFMIMRTNSLNTYKGGNGEEIDLPIVEFKESNVCAYCAIHRKIINIPDVYDSDLFDFTGPKKYDSITGYRTCSMLVLPLVSHEDELLGVLQLINAMDDKSNVIPFHKDMEYIVYSLASQASVSLANMMHMREIKALMDSFIRAFTKAIDERTPYNANHTENVTRYCSEFADFLNAKYERGECPYYLDDNDKEQLLMAARLHDIGKLIVPLEVMNKASRLSPEDMKALQDRFSYIRLLIELRHEKNEISEEEYEKNCFQLDSALDIIMEANSAGFLQDEVLEKLTAISRFHYTDMDGRINPYLTARELSLLSIRKGTLSGHERDIMESHVTMTGNILGEIRFGEKYSKVLNIARSHHEFLDGSGYPEKLTADSIPMEVRIITITDIFDSLRAADRPYKKSMPLERAQAVLREMVKEGKLDHDLVELFCEFSAPAGL